MTGEPCKAENLPAVGSFCPACVRRSHPLDPEIVNLAPNQLD